jgi:hypothetical protein
MLLLSNLKEIIYIQEETLESVRCTYHYSKPAVNEKFERSIKLANILDKENSLNKLYNMFINYSSIIENIEFDFRVLEKNECVGYNDIELFDKIIDYFNYLKPNVIINNDDLDFFTKKGLLHVFSKTAKKDIQIIFGKEGLYDNDKDNYIYVPKMNDDTIIIKVEPNTIYPSFDVNVFVDQKNKKYLIDLIDRNLIYVIKIKN